MAPSMSFKHINDLPLQRALKRARTFPSITAEKLQYEVDTIRAFVGSR